MTAVKTSSSRLKSLGIVSVAAISLLTACGKHGSSEAPLSSVAEKGTQTSPTTQCFYAVGRLSKNDAELFAASGAGNVPRVEQSINAGGNVNATDALKRTPLFAAAFCNRPEVENLLIDKGSDVNARDFIGMSSLHAAVVGGGDEAAKALISRGANIDIPSTAGQTPLHLAAATNQVAMVELLLERGANAQVRDKGGITAASLASKNGHPTVIATIKKWQEKQKTSIPNTHRVPRGAS
ncbi:MAG: ankyrin repeat domain-containing protein [Sulfuricella sp.]